jgi:hypothetical protein
MNLNKIKLKKKGNECLLATIRSCQENWEKVVRGKKIKIVY